MSFPSVLISLVMTLSIASLAPSSGAPRTISLSNRPALLSAGSIASGLFVAPRTMTADPFRVFRGWIESMLVNSCATILFSMDLPPPPPPPSPRLGAMASISSMKTIAGAESDAVSKRVRTRCSLSPLTPPTSSGALTWK